jgi:hypothetical protein
MVNPADVTKLQAVLDRLSALPTPTITLTRKSIDRPTDEQVAWAALVYAYALLHHLRSLLQGIVCEIDDGNTPTALILTRALLELAASAYYVEKHLAQHLNGSRDLTAAWRLLERVVTGSRYSRAYLPPTPGTPQVPESPHIATMMRALNELLKPDEAERTYSDLSEFSHPNRGALALYYDLDLVDGELRASFLSDPSPVQPPPPVAEATLAVAITLPMALRLAGWCDSLEASHFRELLQEIMTAGLL